MANTIFSIPAPPDDRPARNGTDYDAMAASAERDPWPGLSDICDPSRTETDPELGVTPGYVASHPDRVRSRWSAGSLTAIGPIANEPPLPAEPATHSATSSTRATAGSPPPPSALALVSHDDVFNHTPGLSLLSVEPTS